MARRKSSKRKSRKLRRKLRRKSRKRRRRGGLMPQEESFEKAYVGPKEYGSLGSPTCYGPRDCTSAQAKRDKKMCLSYGYNPKTGQTDCQWGVPPAPKPVAPVMAPAPKPVAPVMAPTYKTDDRCRNLKGKVSARCGIRHSKAECEKKEGRYSRDRNKKKWKKYCKWTGDVMAPMVCEDDMTFIRQGPHSTGRPLCEIIKSRKAEIAREKDPAKRGKMVQMVIKNCSNKGATYCKKTCGKCPKKKGGKKSRKKRKKRRKRKTRR